jgi:hypothetical protein
MMHLFLGIEWTSVKKCMVSFDYNILFFIHEVIFIIFSPPFNPKKKCSQDNNRMVWWIKFIYISLILHPHKKKGVGDCVFLFFFALYFCSVSWLYCWNIWIIWEKTWMISFSVDHCKLVHSVFNNNGYLLKGSKYSSSFN